MSRLKSLSIAARLLVLTLIAAIGLGTVALVAALDARERLMEGHKEATKHQVENAVSLIDYYGALADEGTLTQQEAQEAAAASVGAMRYADDNYYWILDSERVVMHPLSPDLLEKDLAEITDVDGQQFFVEFVTLTQAEGEGFVDYRWPRPGGDTPKPKIAYVEEAQYWGWIAGSGIYVDDVQAAFYGELRKLLFWSAGALAIIVGAALVITRSITVPLRRVSDILATGDVTVRLDTGREKTELDRLAGALNGTLGRVGGVISDVDTVSGELDQSARQLAAVTDRLSQGAASATDQAISVASTSGEVSERISTVAAGVTQMGASISEIAGNANEGARTAAEAVETASRTNGLISRLGESSNEIGEFLKIVTSIAAQTNLLALNATIEAARAGESGRGFAVVASEVKELAQETTRAAEDMVTRVEALRGDAAEAATAIEEIAGVISRISEFQVSIAGAVEEQEATTSEMSRSVSETANGGQEIASTINAVATATQRQQEDVSGLRQEASQLVETSARLQRAMAVFRQ